MCNVPFNDKVLRNNYIYYHFINEYNYLLKELFSPDNASKRYDDGRLEFKNCRLKKNHNFLFHYNQTRGDRYQQIPIIILRHGAIFYYF